MQPIDKDLLPNSVREMMELVGLRATLAIVEARGGVRLSVPKQAKPDHWLAGLVGIDALRMLVDYYAGEEIDVPRCAAAIRARREREIAEAPESNAVLARRYGYTERGIRKLKRRVAEKMNDRQDDLFAVRSDGDKKSQD